MAETVKAKFKSSDKDHSKGGAFFDFTIGIILIGLAIPMIWMNERKQVVIYKLIEKAKESVKTVDIDNVSDSDNFKLVQAKGMLKTKVQLNDERFNLAQTGALRLKRTVEVLQWVEYSKEDEEDESSQGNG